MDVKSRSAPEVKDPPTDSIRRLIRVASWVAVPCNNNSAVRLAKPSLIGGIHGGAGPQQDLQVNGGELVSFGHHQGQPVGQGCFPDDFRG